MNLELWIYEYVCHVGFWILFSFNLLNGSSINVILKVRISIFLSVAPTLGKENFFFSYYPFTFISLFLSAPTTITETITRISESKKYKKLKIIKWVKEWERDTKNKSIGVSLENLRIWYSRPAFWDVMFTKSHLMESIDGV